MHSAVIDDSYIRSECQRAIKDPIDDAIVPIRFVDRRHYEYDLDAVADANGMDGAHLSSDRVFVPHP